MNFEKFLRNGIIGILFLIPFTALIVGSGYLPSLFFPFITGKNFFFRVAIEIISILWLILAFSNVDYRPKKSYLLYAIAIFFGIVTLASIFGENVYNSFWSNYERMEGLLSHLHFLMYFIVIISIFQTEKIWKYFFHTSIFVSLVLVFLSLKQFVDASILGQGSVRIDATFGNATYLAVYMLFHIFITAYYAFKKHIPLLLRIGYSILILLQIIVLYLTATRGAILGLIGGVLVACIVFIVLSKGGVKKLAVITLLTVIIGSGVFIAIRDAQFIQESPVLSRFANISISEGTVQSRLLIWNMSFQGFKEHPILGYGLGNYNLVFNKYYNPELYSNEPWFDRAHNIIFDWLIAAGILGLLSYLSLLGAALLIIYQLSVSKFDIASKAIFTGLLFAYLFQNLFVFDNLMSYIMFFSILAFLHFKSSSIEVDRSIFSHIPIVKKYLKNLVNKNENERILPNFKWETLTHRNVATLLIVAIGCMGIYAANYKPYVNNTTLIQAISRQSNTLLENLAVYKKALSYNSFGYFETTEQFARFALQVGGIEEIPTQIKSEFLEEARIALLIMNEKDSQNARYELFLGHFLGRIGVLDEALAHIERAHELSPGKQSIYFEQAAIYDAMGNSEKTLESLKAAYELAPSFREAAQLYGWEFFRQKGVKNIGVVREYVLDREQEVLDHPNESNLLIILAEGYILNGEVDKAKVTYEKAIKLVGPREINIEDFIKKVQSGRRVS